MKISLYEENDYPSVEHGCWGSVPLHFFFIGETSDEEVEFCGAFSESCHSFFSDWETSAELSFDVSNILGLRLNLTSDPSLQVVKINWSREFSTKGGGKDTHVEFLEPVDSNLKFLHNLAVLVKTGHIHPHLVDTLPHGLKSSPAVGEVLLEGLEFLEKLLKGLVSNSLEVSKFLVLVLDLDVQDLDSGFPLEFPVRDGLGEDF